jgi:hypothetical protein
MMEAARTTGGPLMNGSTNFGATPLGVMGKREPQTIDDRSIHPERSARWQTHREISGLRRNSGFPRGRRIEVAVVRPLGAQGVAGVPQPAGGTASTVSFGRLKRRCIGDGVAAETAFPAAAAQGRLPPAPLRAGPPVTSAADRSVVGYFDCGSPNAAIACSIVSVSTGSISHLGETIDVTRFECIKSSSVPPLTMAFSTSRSRKVEIDNLQNL